MHLVCVVLKMTKIINNKTKRKTRHTQVCSMQMQPVRGMTMICDEEQIVFYISICVRERARARVRVRV